MAFNYNSSDFVNQAIADQGSSYLIIQGIPHVSGTSDYNIATNALRNVNYLSDEKDAQAIDLNNDSSEIELKKNTRITGDLTVVGQQTSIGCTALYISDNTIKIASNNNADLIDGSVYMQFNDGATGFAGWMRDHNDGDFKFFNTATEPADTVSDYSLANLHVGGITGSTGMFGSVRGDLVHGSTGSFDYTKGVTGTITYLDNSIINSSNITTNEISGTTGTYDYVRGTTGYIDYQSSNLIQSNNLIATQGISGGTGQFGNISLAGNMSMTGCWYMANVKQYRTDTMIYSQHLARADVGNNGKWINLSKSSVFKICVLNIFVGSYNGGNDTRELIKIFINRGYRGINLEIKRSSKYTDSQTPNCQALRVVIDAVWEWHLQGYFYFEAGDDGFIDGSLESNYNVWNYDDGDVWGNRVWTN